MVYWIHREVLDRKTQWLTYDRNVSDVTITINNHDKQDAVSRKSIQYIFCVVLAILLKSLVPMLQNGSCTLQ